MPPQAIGDYEVLGELGRGAMGIVHRARHLVSGRSFALKVVPATRPEDFVRFEREAALLARLEHPHIVRIEAAFRHQNLLCVAMELLPGGTLRERLGRVGRLAPEEALALVAKLALAADHAHERGIVHRDLKPENVLFDAAGEPRIADFGLSKEMTAASFTTVGALVGTPSYAAPEQVRGDTAVDGKCDVWALGVLLHELVAGEVPFRGASVVQLLEQVLRDEPAPLALPRSRGAERARAIIAAALAKDPARRPTGRALAAMCAAAGEEGGVRRIALAVAACLLAVALLLTASALTHRARVAVSPPPPSPGAGRPGPSPPEAPGRDPERALTVAARGLEAYARRRYGDAAAAFEESVALDPTRAEGWAELGTCRRILRDDAGARAAFERALALNPNNVLALVGRGDARRTAGDTAGATADGDLAIELNPKFADAWVLRAALRNEAQDADGTIAAASRAIELGTRMGFAHLYRSHAFFLKGDLDAALADLDEACRREPDAATIFEARAYVRYKRRDDPGSIDDATKSLALEPRRSFALFVRGLARKRRSEPAAAAADLEAALEAGLAPAYAEDARRVLAQLRRG